MRDDLHATRLAAKASGPRKAMKDRQIARNLVPEDGIEPSRG